MSFYSKHRTLILANELGYTMQVVECHKYINDGKEKERVTYTDLSTDDIKNLILQNKKQPKKVLGYRLKPEGKEKP